MTAIKSKCVCEVCGGLLKHHGSTAGIQVGCKLNGSRRLVHESCWKNWLRRKDEIKQSWVELTLDLEKVQAPGFTKAAIERSRA